VRLVNDVANKSIRKKISGATMLQALVIVASLSLISGLVFFAMGYVVSSKSRIQKKEIKTEEVSTIPEVLYNKEAFNGIDIIGKSFVIYDPIKKEIIAQKEADKVYPLASITKVMTGLVAYKYIEQNEKIKILASDLAPEGDSKLRIGDVWSRDDLISYTLSVSSNDGARALARTAGIHLANTTSDAEAQVKAFIAAMNSSASEYGLGSLSFKNESGLDVDTVQSGGNGNAIDTAKLFAKGYFEIPALFESTTESVSYISSSDGNNRTQNTNIGASNIPGLAASKTGYTDSALGNLGVVVEIGPGRPVVIVVLHSTREGRFSDVERLRKATLKSMQSVEINPKTI
jgi:D-alanyl-D-alanine endopeptidase (penicillin-binding protein 7)